MIEKKLYEHYQIYPERIIRLGEDKVVFANGKQYLLKCCTEQTEKSVTEQINMAKYLSSNNEKNIANLIKTKSDSRITAIDGQEMIVCEIPQHSAAIEKSNGRKLAMFHMRGETYWLGDQAWQGTWLVWDQRWIKRLDQLENWYVKKRQDPEKTELDELLLFSFPYYLGLTENSIQMMYEIKSGHPFSVREASGNTICHFRFHKETWLTLDERQGSAVKIPTDFVYDHFTRDVSEYIREIALGKDKFEHKKKRIERFLYRYNSVRPLKEVDIKLILARCLFPIYYINQIERLYQSLEKRDIALCKEELLSTLARAEEYERIYRHLVTLLLKKDNIQFSPEWVSS